MAPPIFGAGAALLLALSGGNGGVPNSPPAAESSPARLTRRAALASLLPVAAAAATSTPALADDGADPKKPQFRRYPQIRFIAALGDPSASSGAGSDAWGLWRDDPGPRGVYLRDYDSRIASSKNNVAPAGWTFRRDDWWLEEHGLIMSNPDELPRKRYDKESGEVVPYKRYVVTGDREVTSVLTVTEDGRWDLAKGTLYDVTHLPCRSARYTQPAAAATTGAVEVGATGTTTAAGASKSCAPLNADRKAFPVKPGAEMPPVAGCAKQDYAVLFVLGEEA
uniref:Secreted protein n=1 Tax=Odontella aurita TaxID=265563 RepID=A0A7S4N9V1_9STRA|mmetsp:Transcript_54026/g.161719  ORF Transcript_54026/g.161719 Transcript_54026/m.161719 type:complete len:280 (+) Transcript_54026:147-986(+)|eukprot:CAMPEP_0113541990 /NCGR_PEP_ID=MMETSP0015_2-20120614/9351_1 /TAXON_ID=2838 /ORGANISM="Odontella" /LENGTH=279 /DNA_ID=CAMNT_0000441983 /DNA_START=75 /DNA_END=914 /DNA_ORIENTATION=- /assembly_acc=CAM_ASM_000160